jgi:hypothetical protein
MTWRISAFRVHMTPMVSGKAQHHQLPRIPNRQHAKKSLVKQTEHCGIRAYRKSKRDHRNRGKPRVAPKPAKSIPKIAQQRLHKPPWPFLAALLAHALPASKRNHRLSPCFLARHPRRNVDLYLPVDVKLQFFIDLSPPLAANEKQKARKPFG